MVSLNSAFTIDKGSALALALTGAKCNKNVARAKGPLVEEQDKRLKLYGVYRA